MGIRYSIWPSTQKYKFNRYKQNPIEKKINLIENFFNKKYNSKYCALLPSARSGILQLLIFKKFDKTKIVQVPLWSSNCLYETLGSIANLSCVNTNAHANILVHHFGLSFKINKSKNLIIDDSCDSLPTEKFEPYKASNSLEIISLPKIIGSFGGGIALTKNKNFYKFLKFNQFLNIKHSHIQSYKKFKCMLKNYNNYDWHFNETKNFSLDYNLVENIFQNLDFFEINLKTIHSRKEIFYEYDNFRDKYRLGPCLILKNKKKHNSLLKTYHINASRIFGKGKYNKFLVLPIHFSVDQNWIEERINEFRKN